MKATYTLSDLRDAMQSRQGEQKTELSVLRPGKAARLAVIGNPIAHSRSPQMHQAALDQLGIEGRYLRIHLTSTAEFHEGLELLEKLGFLGCNVTLPFKEEAGRYLFSPSGSEPSKDPLVRTFGVANTIHFPNRALFNTDAGGFQRAVEERFQRALGEMNCLVLGAAGGAGRVISYACAAATAQGKGSVRLVNRTSHTLTALARNELAEFAPILVTAEALCGLDPAAIDLIVNATPLGLKSHDPSPLPAEFLRSHHLVYDTTYGCKNALYNRANAVGAMYSDGLSMLVHQGALAFEHWFSLQPGLNPLPYMKAAVESF